MTIENFVQKFSVKCQLKTFYFFHKISNLNI